MVISILLLTSVTTFLLILLLYQYIHRKKLHYMGCSMGGSSIDSPVLEQEAQWRDIIQKLGRLVAPLPGVTYFDEKMLQAGLLLTGSEFVVLSLLSVLVTVLLTFVLGCTQLLLLLVSGVAALCVIYLLLCIRINRRQRKLEKQLEGALGLMAASFRSGLGIPQTIELTASETEAPLALELERLSRELSFGISLEEGLRRLTNRVRLEEMDMVATAIVIQRQVGGNLAVLLDNVAETIRERLQFKREVSMLTAQGRLSGWVVGLLPFVLGFTFYWLLPDYLSGFLQSESGKKVMLLAVAWQLIGLIMIRKISNIGI